MMIFPLAIIIGVVLFLLFYRPALGVVCKVLGFATFIYAGLILSNYVWEMLLHFGLPKLLAALVAAFSCLFMTTMLAGLWNVFMSCLRGTGRGARFAIFTALELFVVGTGPFMIGYYVVEAIGSTFGTGDALGTQLLVGGTFAVLGCSSYIGGLMRVAGTPVAQPAG